MGAGEFLIDVKDVHKSFRGVRALRGVSLAVAAGETLGLVGPNGAGKSTLVNIIAGVLKPDAGSVVVAGRQADFNDPMQARHEGVMVVPQEVQLFPRMSAAANLSAGLVVRRRGWFVTTNRDRRLLEEISERLGVSLKDEHQLGFASAEVQRLIMVGQAVLEGAKVLILDEPTAGLTPRGCEAIYAALETMRRPDVAVIYVTHKFDEVSRLCDRGAVVVDGHLSQILSGGDLTRAKLSAAVSAGAEVVPDAPPPPHRARAESASGTDGFVLKGTAADGGSWEIPLARGAITAVAGLADSGVEDVVRAVTGRGGAAVQVLHDDASVQVRDPRGAALAGISYVGGQRGQSSFPAMSIMTNVALGKVKLGHRGINLNRRKERVLTREALTAVGLNPDDAHRPLGTLSGGNQQRALFARQGFAGGRLLVVDDPTVGVDVNGRGRIHSIIRKVAAEGAAVLLYSSDPEECAELAHDIYVFVGGSVVNHLSAPTLPAELVMQMARSSVDASPAERRGPSAVAESTDAEKGS